MNEQMLKEQAKEIRKDIVTMIGQAKSGHPGGSLSATEIVTYLYFEELRIDPTNPKWDDRDRFILSKGHAAPVLYAALARRGFFPTEELSTLRKIGSHLQGHPDMKRYLVSICLQALWERDSLLQQGLQWLASWIKKRIMCIHFWAMEKYRKVKYGEQLCLLPIINWII